MEPTRTAAQIDQGAWFTPDGVLGALLRLAEQHQGEGETLEAAFGRVLRETEVGRRLYVAFREAESHARRNGER
jgi:hypothetical protein